MTGSIALPYTMIGEMGYMSLDANLVVLVGILVTLHTRTVLEFTIVHIYTSPYLWG
jgi:hypothetical protein